MITDEQLEEAITYFNELYEQLHIFDLNRRVKLRASEAFPVVIGTLEALHLATASIWANMDSEPLVVFTLDNQMKRCTDAPMQKLLVFYLIPRQEEWLFCFRPSTDVKIAMGSFSSPRSRSSSSGYPAQQNNGNTKNEVT